MASIVLTTGPATVFSNGEFPTVINGTEPFGDDDEGTFITTYGSTSPSPRGAAVADLQQLTAGGTVTDIIFTVSAASVTTGPASGFFAGVIDTDDLFHDFGFGATAPGGGLVTESTYSVADSVGIDDPLAVAWIARLRAGSQRVMFLSQGIAGTQANCHALTVTVVLNVMPPPLRRYPPVNNGGSGPTRHYPRAVNRRAGGTY